MPRRHFPLVAIAVLAVSCSDNSPKNETANIPEPTKQVMALKFPLDKYELSNSDTHVIYEANDVLIRDCMQKRGHDWEVISTPKDVEDWRNRLHFGVIEADVARSFGYHSPAQLQAPPEVRKVVERIKDRFASLETDEARAAEKCMKAADHKLTRDAKASFSKLNNFKEKTYSDAQRDPAVLRAVKAWSTCMRKAGFKYTTPTQAGGDSKWREQSEEEPSREEMATAEADVRCKLSTNLIDRWFAAERKLEEQVIREHSDYFDAIKAANARYIDNARSVLAQR